MRKITFLLLACIIGLTFNVRSQSSFLFDENMAVFYPAGFDATQTLPSLAIEKELVSIGPVPGTCKINPVYGMEYGKVTVSISYDWNADLYGTGEVVGPLRRNNTEVTMWNTDNYGYYANDGKQLYQSHPWIMGVRPDGTSFGIIADHTWKQRITLSNPIKITTEGPSFRVIVIERENPAAMMKALADLIGTINLPPLWAIGHQQCRYSYSSDAEVRSIAKGFRDRQIPCDVIWMDIDYMGNTFQNFTFNNYTFPDPVGLNKHLNDNKFKSIYIVDAATQQNSSYSVYNQGIAGNHFVQNSSRGIYIARVWPGNSAFPDYTRPETRAWWHGLQKNYMQYGADGIWNDMNEPAIFDVASRTMPEDNWHRGGGGLPEGSHLRYHNVYGMLMSKTTYEAMLDARPERRAFALTRASFLGGQRYTATWTGDNLSTWEHLKLSVPMTITLGLSGQPFNGPDIGGFTGTPTPELFGHWIALGAFYPFSRNHADITSPRQEPWSFGAAIENVSRTAIGRRYRLLPYFYTVFQESSQTGMPVMRPVFFADPTDLSLRSEDQVFLLGENLLIYPRWANNPKLPKGNWKKIKLEDTDDGYQVNVLLKPGAIVPMGKLIQSTADYNTDNITLLLNPNEDGSAYGKLYDDAGEGFGFKTGDYAVHEFTSSKDGDRLKIEITQKEGNRNVNRQYRIGYVIRGDVVYSNYSSATTQYIDEPDEPESSTITISAMVPSDWTSPKIHVWDPVDNSQITTAGWPGDAMTKVSGNLFTITLSGITANEIGVVINNGSGKQTVNLYTAGNICWNLEATPTASEGKYNATVSSMCLFTAKINAMVPSGWTSPKIYAWDPIRDQRITVNGWPGDAMTYVSGNLFTATLSGFAVNEIGVIINNGTGTQQTVDLFTVGDICWELEATPTAAAGKYNATVSTGCQLTAIDKIKTNKVLVYPNPVENILKIDAEDTISKATILSVSGSRVMVSNEQSIDVSTLSSGIYLLKIEFANSPVVYGKFLKK